MTPDLRLLNWAAQHLGLSDGENRDWSSRAWWGLAAGELIRVHLYDPALRAEALAVVDCADWSSVDNALARGGVILAAAHIGPPKLAMNLVIDRFTRPLILTNLDDAPGWMKTVSGPVFLNPLSATDRTAMPVKIAMHLREGGLVFGAPDGGFSAQQIVIRDFNKDWLFSPGLPVLARLLNVPAFLVLALWEGQRVKLRVTGIASPDPGLSGDAWFRQWIDNYWRQIAPVVASSAENLRFLMTPFRAEFGT